MTRRRATQQVTRSRAGCTACSRAPSALAGSPDHTGSGQTNGRGGRHDRPGARRLVRQRRRGSERPMRWRGTFRSPRTGARRLKIRSEMCRLAGSSLDRRRALVRAGWASGAGEADEFEAFAAVLGLLLHHADAVDVVLVVDDGRLERGVLLGAHSVREVAEADLDRHAEVGDSEVVLGVALVVLLPVVDAEPRCRGGVDPGLCAVHSGLERALPGLDAAVRVEGGGLLAEVPDVAGLVLGVPVVGLLGR